MQLMQVILNLKTYGSTNNGHPAHLWTYSLEMGYRNRLHAQEPS